MVLQCCRVLTAHCSEERGQLSGVVLQLCYSMLILLLLLWLRLCCRDTSALLLLLLLLLQHSNLPHRRLQSSLQLLHSLSLHTILLLPFSPLTLTL